MQARRPEQATIGKTIRFMYYEPGYPDGDAAAYWMQGELKSRLDTLKKARASNFSRNRFKVEKLEVIFCWGTLGTIPETITVNLSKSTVWSLGSVVTVATAKNEVITFEEDESCVTKEHIMTTGVGENRISLEEDTEEDGTPLSEGGSKTRCSHWNPHHNYYRENISETNEDDQSSSDEEEANKSSSEEKEGPALSYWDPRDDCYKNKRTHQVISENIPETGEDGYDSSDEEDESDSFSEEEEESVLSYWDPQGLLRMHNAKAPTL